MTLPPGARLGEYEIVGAIGAGGMGEVYRALDTGLGREVAIKVLPTSFAADPDRVARFGREARLLASLNHPAIATLHGFHSEGGTRFLVMELVEGETLAARLQRGPLPVPEALELFIAIARGLEAAHERGVIHRDLKPANLKLLPDGGSTGVARVKILDFGLAKAMAHGDDSDAAPLSHSPTLTLAATLRGEVLGTAAYMSPEQAKGRPVDRRTDVFAFGACLYEALVGRPAFDGDTVTEIMAAVLKVEPDWDALPVEAGPALRRLLRSCLTKDPAERLHDVADARLELQRIAGSGDGEAAVAAARPRPVWRGAGLGALAGAIAAGGIALLLGGSDRRPEVPVSHLNLALPPGQRLAFGAGSALAISADGRQIVYVGRDETGSRLYHRSLDSIAVTPLPDTEEASDISISPDGGRVAFIRGDELRTVSPGEGRSRRVARAGMVRGEAWDAAGRILFGQRTGTLQRVAGDGGEVETLIAKRDIEDYRLPAPVPGRNAAVFRSETLGDSKAVLQVADFDTGEVRDLAPGTSPRFLSRDVLLWVRDGALWAGRFDADALALASSPRRVVDGLATVGIYGQYDVSASGTLVYASGAEGDPSYGLFGLSWIDRAGKRTAVDLVAGDYQAPELSADGSLLLLSIADASGRNAWILNLERGVLSRFTFDGAMSATWSADGRRIYYSSTADPGGIYSRAADGTGEVTTHLRFEPGETYIVADATPDGSALILSKHERAAPFSTSDIVELALADGAEPRPLLAESYSEVNAELSPDGRWLAYQSDESGTAQIYVRPYPDLDSGKWQVSTHGAREPVWRPDGGELYFQRGVELRGVVVEGGPVFRFGPERAVLVAEGPALGSPRYDVHPDGRFLFLTEGEDPDREPPQIVVIERFDREVERILARP